LAVYRQDDADCISKQVEDNLAALEYLEREAPAAGRGGRVRPKQLAHSLLPYIVAGTNYLQVIAAQTAYLDNERNRVEIRRRRMEATVLLVKALGGWMECGGTPDTR